MLMKKKLEIKITRYDTLLYENKKRKGQRFRRSES